MLRKILVVIFSRRTEKNSKIIFTINVEFVIFNFFMLKLAFIFFFLPFFSDEKLEDLKAQKRKIVSDAYIH